MKFLIDAQLPPALAATLRQNGCDAVAVREVGLREAKDTVIWQYALDQNSVIITKDEDFVQRSLCGAASPVIRHRVSAHRQCHQSPTAQLADAVVACRVEAFGCR